MDRRSKQAGLLILGFMAWGFGTYGTETLELASIPWRLAGLLVTAGLVTLMSIVAVGVFNMLRV